MRRQQAPYALRPYKSAQAPGLAGFTPAKPCSCRSRFSHWRGARLRRALRRRTALAACAAPTMSSTRGSFEDHAGFEILQRLDTLFEHCGLEGRARIAAGLFQLAQNVGHSRQTKGVIGEALRLDLAKDLCVAD